MLTEAVKTSCLNWHLVYDINFFYNSLTDIVVNNPSNDPDAPKFINSGSLKVAGAEAELNFSIPSFRVDANMTYLRRWKLMTTTTLTTKSIASQHLLPT